MDEVQKPSHSDSHSRFRQLMEVSDQRQAETVESPEPILLKTGWAP
jgi:hypothetical protein